jgi:hypothetical protein
LNIQSNKVKITGHGNSGSDYNSYREIQFYTEEPLLPAPALVYPLNKINKDLVISD